MELYLKLISSCDGNAEVSVPAKPAAVDQKGNKIKYLKKNKAYSLLLLAE